MKTLVSLCFLALALVCHGKPPQSSLSSLEDLSNRRHQSNPVGVQLSRRQLNNLAALLQSRRQLVNQLQKLNSNPLLSSLEHNSQNLQQLRRHLSSLDVNSQENPTPQVRGQSFGVGIF